MMTNSDQNVEPKKAKTRSTGRSRSESALPTWNPGASNSTAPIVAAVISASRKGVARQKITEVQKMGLLSKQEMADALHLSVRSLYPVSAQSNSQKEHLDTSTSERLLLLEQLLLHGLAVFDGDAKGLSFWLHSPLSELSVTEETVNEATPLPIQEMGQLDKPYFMAGVLPASDRGQAAHPSPPQTPLDMLDTVSGYSLVDAVLSRIEWGIYS